MIKFLFEEKMNTLICPNAGSCLLYDIYHRNAKGKPKKEELKADCIEYDGEKYSCAMIKYLSSDRKIKRLKNFEAKCALITLLNNSKSLLDLCKKA